MDYFEFKNFRIYHNKCGMKVGTDGVLLGAWADVENSQRILDIGCGSGLISIMVSQRSNAKVTGIDIDINAVEQAKENVKASPYNSRIEVFQQNIIDYEEKDCFDTIISNPPFFLEETISSSQRRSLARSASFLGYKDLITSSKRLMKDGATLQVILPTQNVKIFRDLCTLYQLSLIRQTDICTKYGKKPKRSLLHFINKNNATIPIHSLLTILDCNGNKTDEYKLLTKDYYIH